MSHDLREQIREVVVFIEDSQTPILGGDIRAGTVRRIAPSDEARPPIRRVTIVAVAFAVVMILVGGVALLGRFAGDGVAPTNEPAATTTTLSAAPVVPDTTVDTIADVPTTLPVSPVNPPGEGPSLAFVQVDDPPDVTLSGGVWFKGALYAVSRGSDFYRSTDGIKWEVVPRPPPSVGAVRESILQTDGDRLVNVVVPESGITSIEVFTSPDGDNWASTIIQAPIPIGSNMAGEFGLGDVQVAVGSKGIVVTATIDVSFEGEGFANSLVDPDEGIHVEVVDLDLDRGVMIVKFLDENNDMAQIGDPREIDLNSAGFSGAFSNLLDAMADDPDWEPLVPGFLAQLTNEPGIADAEVSVGYAWFSSDGVAWQRVGSTGPLAGGEFSGIVATPDGFVATASSPYKPSELPEVLRYLAEAFDSSVVWQSDDGMTWTEATGLISSLGAEPSKLVEWQGVVVEHVGVGRVYSLGDNTEVWTLASPRQRVFPDVPTNGMVLAITDLGLIGVPSYGWAGPDATELLFSIDGTEWNRWEPPEFDIGGTSNAWAWLVGVGIDFVVIQVSERDGVSGSAATYSQSLWVARFP